jgi:pilus assembly protein Flp/PilA
VIGASPMLSRLKAFLVEEDGPSAVEYAIMLALILLTVIGTVGTLGTKANATFTNLSSEL